MRIANPIYDSVFKYLLSDPEVARLMISTITELDIVSVEPHNTEQIGRFSPALCVFRLDFCARIRLANGETQLVLIEIQKAKLPEYIMRFRRYLGEQYANKNNLVTDIKNGREVSSPLPIISIYFLGHQLDGIQAPVIKVRRQYFDAITREELKARAQFIECLSHDSFVIQIPLLQEPARSRLEKLLNFFDQHHADPDNEHQLIIDEDSVTPEFRSIARSLVRAGESSAVRKEMTLEDDFLESILNLERESMALAEVVIKNAEAQAESAIKKAEEQAQKAEEQAQKAEEQAQKAGMQAQKVGEQLRVALATLIARGMSEDEARRVLGL